MSTNPTNDKFGIDELLKLTGTDREAKALYQSSLRQTHGGGFPNRLNFDSPERTEGGSPWRQRLVFGMTMTRARFGRRRNDRRTVRKREDSWLLRRSTTGPRAPRRRRSAASDCRWFAIGVMKFNADGPEGLIDRKAPRQPPRLNDGHRAALAA